MLRKIHWIISLIAAFISLAALLPAGYMLYRQRPPQIMTVDLQQLVEEQQSLFQSSSQVGAAADLAVAEKNALDFAKKLSTAVDELGNSCHCVVVNKAAVLGGKAQDVTHLIKERMGR